MLQHVPEIMPPTSPSLLWRSLNAADVEAITVLGATGLAADGGLPLLANAAFVQDQYVFEAPGVTLGGVDAAGQLVACAAVRAAHTEQAYRTTIVGQVHPAYRRHGIGTFLVRWSMAQARHLLASCPGDRPHIVSLATESLTEAAAKLYIRYGFAQQFSEDVMRRPLDAPFPTIVLPPNISFTSWNAALATQFFEVYQAAFRERPGYPDWSAEQWIMWITEDEDFRPEQSLLAYVDQLPVGFIVCSDTWIVQVGVRPEWRARGIGSALICEVLRRLHAAGHAEVLLTVNTNNPRAARIYRQLGFHTIGQRARYEQALPTEVAAQPTADAP